ncbi:uncharacterized protein LOC124258747 [Haliotis rubra]|uniref:uncharacterized protein LOC124258747 n=1 Tax=Haliotis rubra TaxID=36100 RepID=UPI001EE5C7D6|nr:uncharacterized protein LOC124258747 [Haliotis rubra]
MSLLDLALVMDCTGSMGSYIDSARENIRHIIDQISSAGGRSVHFALVEYRDHPPQDKSFITKPHNFTSQIANMKSWLRDCSADGGGGDEPEAVADGLQALLTFSWRSSATKIAVLIADAPPHGLGTDGDGFPLGCPLGHNPFKVTNKLASQEITLYVAGCEPSISPYKDFFTGLAYITGGQYVPLASANNLAKIIVCGAEEEMSLEHLMKTEVGAAMKQLQDAGVEIDEDLMELHLSAEMARKGITTKKLRETMPMAEYRRTDLTYARPASVASAAVGDVFDVEESEVDYAQVQRMVQKSKMRNKALFED